MAKYSRENRPAKDNGNNDKDDKESGRSSYKAKRSFTRNKGLRENEKSSAGREGGWKKRYPEKDKEKTDRPYKGRPSASPGDRGERSDRAGDRKKTADTDKRSGKRTAYGSDRDKERSRPDRERPSSKSDDRRTGKRTSYAGRKDEERTGSDRKRSFRPESERASSRRRPTEGWRDSERTEDSGDRASAPKRVKHRDFEEGRSFQKQKVNEKIKPGQANRKAENEGLVRLNKYLANAGLSSRREADTLIQSGAVKVNGVVVDQLGFKVKPGDKVTYGDEAVKGERKVYLLINKPKDYITTVDDPRDRKTVMELIKGACRERVYPVGRLDRNTTGVLLMTNDGELTKKLTHPKYNVKKVYNVTLDKNLKTDDFKALVDGIELEDGPANADDLAFVGEGKREIGIEIHSGRNRVVRRMFEHLGYNVVKLDRVVFAGLTKKDLARGRHRFLTAREVSFLKMIG